MHRHWTISALGLAAGVALLLGGLIMSWWSYPDGDLAVSIGLREARMCRAGQAADACSTVSLQRLTSVDHLSWLRAGTGAYAAAWMAAILSLAVGGLSAARKTSRLLGMTSLVAAASAGTVGLLFVTWVPADLARDPGLGMVLYFAGVLLAAASAVLSQRPAPAA
jgi:hypothetical protein